MSSSESKTAVITVSTRKDKIPEVLKSIRRMKNIREARAVDAADFDIYVLVERHSVGYLDRMANAICDLPGVHCVDIGVDQEL